MKLKFKTVMLLSSLAVALSGCSTLKKVVYRIDVPQGNYLEQYKIDQLQLGMNKTQVAYLLGEPVLRDSFSPTRWDYVFIQRKGHEEPIQRTLLVYFNEQGLVSQIDDSDTKK